MSSRIRKAVAYKRKHRNSITLGNLGRIDNAEMQSLKVKLHRSSLWLKRLEQTATKYLSFLTVDWKTPLF